MEIQLPERVNLKTLSELFNNLLNIDVQTLRNTVSGDSNIFCGNVRRYKILLKYVAVCVMENCDYNYLKLISNKSKR